MLGSVLKCDGYWGAAGLKGPRREPVEEWELWSAVGMGGASRPCSGSEPLVGGWGTSSGVWEPLAQYDKARHPGVC